MGAIVDVLHHYVIYITKFLMLILEFAGAIIIVYSSIITLYRFVRLSFNKSSTELRIRLGRGLSMGLQYYLAAEILRLITIRDYNDLAIVGVIILLHVIVSLLVSWEVHHSLKVIKEETELDEECAIKEKERIINEAKRHR